MLKRHWCGRIVRLLSAQRNEFGGIFIAGTYMHVDKNFGGLHLSTPESCDSCECRGWTKVKGVPMRDVELMPKEFKLEPIE